jgi:hypothetical protein
MQYSNDQSAAVSNFPDQNDLNKPTQLPPASTPEEPSKPLISKKAIPNLGIFTIAAPY